MKAIYDCLVVGARPAGGVCAYELAKKGLKVLILEKERLPRLEVCAGGFRSKRPNFWISTSTRPLRPKHGGAYAASAHYIPLRQRWERWGLDEYEG